jgi:D-alanyl-D-alanine carboxypeptidase
MIRQALWGIALGATIAGCGSTGESDLTVTSVAGTGGMGGQAGGGGGGAGQVDACVAFEVALDAIVATTQAATQAPGSTAMAVLTPDCGLWTSSSGDEIEADSLLRVGSVTKTYVAAAVLALAAERALDLDDSLEGWVPGVPNGELITVRQLLNHTAGVFNYTDDLAFMLLALQNPSLPHSPQAMVDVAIDHGADFPPGTAWSYSNTGYVLLGMILEAASGKNAGAVLLEQAFAPAGLERTFLDGDHMLPEPLAPGYAANGGNVTQALHPSVPWTAGAVVADVGDVARWTTALHRGEVLSDEGLAAMREVVPTGNAGHAYGLGMSELSPPILPLRALGHSGGIPGYLSLAFYLPDHDSTIVVIVTGDGRSPGHAFLQGIAAIVER